MSYPLLLPSPLQPLPPPHQQPLRLSCVGNRCSGCRQYAPAQATSTGGTPVPAICIDDLLCHFDDHPRTLRHIPKGSQQRFADIFADTLMRAVSTRSLKHMADVCLLPRFVLQPLKRGGKAHQSQCAKVVNDRIDLWIQGARIPAAEEDMPPKATKANPGHVSQGEESNSHGD
jgi:hypothetical protein